MFNRLFHLPLNNKDSLFIFGPRGTGKTSWLKAHLKTDQFVYIDLLEPVTFRRLQANPELLREYAPKRPGDWIIIDEVQKIPALLDEVHRLI